VVPGEGSQPGAPLGIVAAHGRAGDRRSLIELARLFRSLGHPTLLFDLREHGLSDGADRGMSLGFREAQDVSAATRYMKDTLGMQRVVAIGQSLGGSSVILAAAHDDSIDAVITDSALSSFEGFVFDRADTRLDRLPFGSHLPRLPLHLWSRAVVALSKWRVGAGGLPDPIEEVGHIGPRPVLVMHGTADLAVHWAHAQGLYDSASQPKELWLVEGAQHMSLLEHDPQEYRRRVAAFLARVAGS
jgi:alpha-beta hydrolase superfamily lysophospholipase